MKSLRLQFIVSLIVLISMLLGLAGWIVFKRIKHQLYADADLQLIQRAESMVSMIEIEAGHVVVEWLEEGLVPPGHLEGLDYFTLWNAQDGAVLLNVSGAGSFPLPKLEVTKDAPMVDTIYLPDERMARAVVHSFKPSIDEDDQEEPTEEEVAARVLQLDPDLSDHIPELILIVARKDTVFATMETIQSTLMMAWGGFVVLGGLLGVALTRIGLQPLVQLKRQIQTLQKGVIGQRIRLARTPDELQPVVQELNQLLDNVEQALVRERLLTSNVAHELRNPIAGLLSILEVTLGRLRSTDEYVESTEECFEIAKRMHWLVNNLLSIARIESGNIQLVSQEIKVIESMQQWWTPFNSSAKERHLKISWEIPEEFTLETDPEFLRVVVTNLYDNAVSYAPENGEILIRLNESNQICIANQTMDLQPEIVERVFDPFWRRSESRENPGVHAGLGLNLCRKIIELLGGRIEASLAQESEMFEVRFQIV